VISTRRLLQSLLAAAWALACTPALAQTNDLRLPVEKIAFSDWKEVADTGRVVEYSLAFPSVIQSAHPENNMVPVYAFLPKERQGKVPVVLILHYWGARDIKAERNMADRFAERGIGSVVVTLPYHLGRTPPGYRSGQLAIQPSSEQLRKTMSQATQDVKRAIDFVESRPEFDAGRIGIVGTSLGALVTALVYGVDSRPTHAAFILGGVDLAEIMWSSSLVVEARDAMRRKGYTYQKLQAELTEVEPLTYISSRRSASAFVIGAKFDTIIPRSSTTGLIASFDSPKVLWLDTGHYGGIFIQSRVFKEVANYFETEFGGKPYQPPNRVFAPTLRIGVQAAYPSGFDIGVGVDLWKSNERGDLLAVGLITPRGPQIFLGGRISQGLSFGISGGTSRVGIGLFWSRVL
jgi:hypothetical protein